MWVIQMTSRVPNGSTVTTSGVVAEAEAGMVAGLETSDQVVVVAVASVIGLDPSLLGVPRKLTCWRGTRAPPRYVPVMVSVIVSWSPDADRVAVAPSFVMKKAVSTVFDFTMELNTPIFAIVTGSES